MNRNPILVILSLVALLVVSTFGEPVVDIQKVAGKTVEEVSATLGKPSSQEKTKYGPKFLFKGGAVEVVFIGKKADWITVHQMDAVPFDDHAIEALGLKPTPPTGKNGNVIRWEPHPLYLSVTVFPANGKVDYAYIKVATK